MLLVGMHVDQGYCVRFPAQLDDEPLETWEDWAEADFLAPEGTVIGAQPLAENVLSEAREVLSDAEDGCHLHLHEEED